MRYAALSDTDKMGLLQLLYKDLKKPEQRELILAEAQIVYARLKRTGN